MVVRGGGERDTHTNTFDISLLILGLSLEGAVGVLEAEAVRPVLVDVVVLPDEFRRSSGGGGCCCGALRGGARRADHGGRDRQLEDGSINCTYDPTIHKIITTFSSKV